MKRTIRLLAAPAAAVLLLASCGSSAEPAPSETTVADDSGQSATPAEESSPGESADDAPTEDAGDDGAGGEGNITSVEVGGESYDLDMDALTTGSYPTDSDYYLEGMTGVKAVAEIGVDGPPGLEAFRESIEADPVTYIRFDVDNREGSEEILMLELNMYDAEGQEYKFETMTSAKNAWTEDIEDYSDEQYELSQETEDYDGAAVGQRNEQWLVGPADLPDEVAVMHAISEAFSDEFYPMPLS